MEDGTRKTPGLEERELDLRGLRCPLPALRTRRELRRMKAGAILVVLADDPLARLDITHLCLADGHDLLEAAGAGNAVRFRIARGAFSED